MVWFCFFPPSFEAQGIRRFFQSWGGEALYNQHESDPETGTVLRQIGLPCIVEAIVPIKDDSHAFLETKLTRIYFKNRGIDSQECMLHEGYSTNVIPHESICRVICWPENDFTVLSGNWQPE